MEPGRDQADRRPDRADHRVAEDRHLAQRPARQARATSAPATDWHDLQADDEGFYLRVAGPGEYLYKGADVGILVSRGRLQSNDFRLTPLCRRWVNGIRTQVVATPLDELPAGATPAAVKG